MILGKIIGKTTTKKFSFHIESKAQKFQYVQVMHKDYGYVLCQILEIERDKQEIAHCSIIGYSKNNKIQLPRSPFQQGIEVLNAENGFIKKILNLEQKNAAYIGKLETRDIKVYLDLNSLLTKHVAILAKTGAGKSYSVGVLLEEIIEKKVPLLILDPHGEYAQIAHPNQQEKEALEKDHLEPKGYKESVREYGDTRVDDSFIPLHLNEELGPQELLHILPAKITQSQKATLYSIIKEISPLTLNNLIETLSTEQDISSLNLVAILDYLKSLQLFSSDYTAYEELIQPGRCTIINLKGVPPQIQEIIVYKLLKDLFEQRKLNNIAPFFTVIEEAHNFAPERSFGEAKSSSIIRTIASEGRKFGLGLCVVSQRPARVDKNVLSQCNTQIILKVTNPNDLKSITNSVENITAETAEEIRNLPIGTAIVAGVVDMPLLVQMRTRRSSHGGSTINILDESKDMLKDLTHFKKKEILPLILPKTTRKDLQLIEGKDKVVPILIPAAVVGFEKKKKRYQLLIDTVKGHIIKSQDTKETIPIPRVKLSKSQQEAFEVMARMKRFNLAKLSTKMQLPILKLKDLIEFFEKSKLLEKKKEEYAPTQQAHLLLSPQDFQFFGKIEFRQINYSSKLRPKLTEQEVKQRLHFLGVKDIKKCFLVYYKVE